MSYSYFFCRNITLKKWSFGFLISLGVIAIGAFCITENQQAWVRPWTDNFYAPLLIGTDFEIDGKIPPFGAFDLVRFQSAIFIFPLLMQIIFF